MSSETHIDHGIAVKPGIAMRALVMTLAAGMLGMALQVTDGLYSPAGILILTLSLLLCILSALDPKWLASMPIPVKKLTAFIGILVAVQLLSMLLDRAGASEATVPQVEHQVFFACAGVAVAGLALILFGKNNAARLGFALMLIMFVVMGIWKIRAAPSPKIDVFIFHRDAAAALSYGQNPYTITFPDIYGEAGAFVYGEGVVRNGRLQFGYPYPPVVLLMTSAAQLTFGDSRYAMLLSMLTTGVMISLIFPGKVGMLTAMLLLFTPRSFYVLEQAWTEPLSVMLLTATVLCAIRLPSTAAIMFGLLIASKQYLPATVLLLPVLIPPSDRRFIKFLIISFITAALVTLPLLLWDFKAFWDSAIALQLRQPYRQDSLSYLAWWGFGKTGWKGPFWLCFAAMGTAMLLCWWKGNRGVRAFIASFAFCFFAFFAFNKQAFANYYYLVLGAMCCTIACENCTSATDSSDT